MHDKLKFMHVIFANTCFHARLVIKLFMYVLTQERDAVCVKVQTLDSKQQHLTDIQLKSLLKLKPVCRMKLTGSSHRKFFTE